MVNRCASSDGQELLAKELSTSQKDIESILKRQESIKELAEQVDLRQELLAAGMPEYPSFNKFISIANDSKNKIHPIFAIIARCSSAITIGLTLLAIINIIPAAPAIMMFILQLAISIVFTSKTNLQYTAINKAKRSVKGYSKILSIAAGLSGRFESKELQEIVSGLSLMKAEIKNLDKYLYEFDQRNSGLIYIIVNGFMLRDIILTYKIDKWFKTNAANTEHWKNLISNLDVISSFANFTFNNPEFIFPKISDTIIMEAESLCHPAIPSDSRVGNNITITGPHTFYIVTGANMAGKSTFIRSVGINMILASCGAPVCASSFSFRPVTLFSSMRTSDKLLENSSYFHAELQRLRFLKETAQNNPLTLALLDEILKGTNSKDKLTGSIVVLKTLINLPVAGIAATHDLELSNLEDEMPENFKNLNFEFNVENNEMIFDYKLRKGVAKNMNATALLKSIFSN